MLAWVMDALPPQMGVLLAHPHCDRLSTCATAARALLVRLREVPTPRSVVSLSCSDVAHEQDSHGDPLAALNHEQLLDPPKRSPALAILTVHEVRKRIALCAHTTL